MQKSGCLIVLLLLIASYVGWQWLEPFDFEGRGFGWAPEKADSEDHAPSSHGMPDQVEQRDLAAVEPLHRGRESHPARHEPTSDPKPVIVQQTPKPMVPRFEVPVIQPGVRFCVIRTKAILGDAMATSAQMAALSRSVEMVIGKIGHSLIVFDIDSENEKHTPAILHAKTGFDITKPVKQVFEKLYVPETKAGVAVSERARK